MTTLTVDLDAIAANWHGVSRLHQCPTAAVVKADAYGLGAARVGARLLREGARHFFVAYPEEGRALRPHVPGATVAILNGLFADASGVYVAHDLTPVLGTQAEIEAWATLASDAGRRLPALLHVDTGMNRLGLSTDGLDWLVANLDVLDRLDVQFVMTHLANAELAGDGRNTGQAARFEAARARLPPLPSSFANSSGIFLGERFASDLARPGAALYGINPVPGAPNPMRTTLRLTAPVLQVRDIGVGEQVGYNGIWTARRPTRVATVSAGYADGYHRTMSGAACVGFDGGRLPLIGRVSMDLTTFDATDHSGVSQGSEVELVGPAIPPDEVAAWAGTNGYEVLTSLKPRRGRVYAAL